MKVKKTNEKKKKKLLDHYNNGRYAKAEETAKNIIKKFPDDNFSWMILALIMKDTNRFKDSLKASKKSIELSPKDSVALNVHGIILLELKKYTEAENYFKESINLNPKLAEAYNNLGLVYNNLGLTEKAQEYYLKAISLKENLFEAYHNLGEIFEKINKFDEAIQCQNKAISLKPDYDKAFSSLGTIFYKMNKIEESKMYFGKAANLNPNNLQAKYMYSALIGENITSAPREYVEKLFDDFSAFFDGHLIGQLKYTAPKLIGDILKKNYMNNVSGTVLDLGCGTGLIGEELDDVCAKLVGVDLSKSMIEKARQKKIYDELVYDDIEEYLNREILNFDIIIASDVLIYVGDLIKIFKSLKQNKKTNAKFVFTTEHNHSVNSYKIEKSGRFSHSKKYIDDLCQQFQFKQEKFEIFDMRNDRTSTIAGGLYILGL